MSSNNFKYVSKSMADIIENLPFEVYDSTHFWIIYIKKKEMTFDIECDCRIAAMTLSCLWYDDLSFLIHKNHDNVEIQIPSHCSYITIRFDDDKYNLHRSLKDLQGQWIVYNEEESIYYGLVTEGLIFMSLDKWKERYKKDIIERIEENKGNKCNLEYNLISCLLKMNKFKINNYTAKKMIPDFHNKRVYS